MKFDISIFIFDAKEPASDVKDGDDFRAGVLSEGKIYEVHYTSLSQPDVEKMMKTEVDGLSSILGVEVSHATP